MNKAINTLKALIQQNLDDKEYQDMLKWPCLESANIHAHLCYIEGLKDALKVLESSLK